MAQAERPNILVILTDTHAASAAGCYGSNYVRTPNLDRLARQGVVFDRAYCQNPICLPSRASFLTGRYSCETGALHNDQPYPDIHTIGHHLRDAGYETAALGKMHFIPSWETALGKDRQRGFNRRVDFEEFYWYLRREREYAPLPGYPDDPYRIAFLERMQHLLQAPGVQSAEPLHKYANRTGTLIDEDHFEALVLREWRAFLSEGHAQPFLAYVSFQSPHHPFIPPPEILALYEDVEILLPAEPDEFMRQHPYLKHRVSRADSAFVERYLRYYAAFVTYTDTCIGQVLEALEAFGYDENTLVIYHSDHGEMGFHHGLTGKVVFYEDSVRVPLVMRFPGQFEGGWHYEGLVELIDLFPTICDAAGVDAPDDLRGRSLLSDLRQRSNAGKEAVFSELYPMYGSQHAYADDRPARMVATQEWKLIQYSVDYENLYHLAGDPLEMHELSTDPAHEATRQSLRDLLHARLGDVPEPEPLLRQGYYAKQQGWFDPVAGQRPNLRGDEV